jgi:N4-gp56 family major capsid protein
MPTYFSADVLKVLRPRLEFQNLSTKINLPENAGDTISLLKYTRMAGSTTALTEGTPTSGATLTTTATTAEVSSWAQFITLTDESVRCVVDNVVKNASEELLQQGMDTIDLLYRNAATAATKVYAAAVTALTGIVATSVMSMTDVRKMERRLDTAMASKFSDGFYRWIIHPYQKYDLLSATAVGEWNDIKKYTESGFAKNAEIGNAYGFRFYVSQNAYTTTSGTSASNTAYYSAVAGAEAIAGITMKGGGAPKKYYSPPQHSVADPNKNLHLISVNIPFLVPKIISSTAIYAYVSGATQ